MSRLGLFLLTLLGILSYTCYVYVLGGGLRLRDKMADYELALDGLPSLANTLRAIPSCTMSLDHYTQKNTRRTRRNDT